MQCNVKNQVFESTLLHLTHTESFATKKPKKNQNHKKPETKHHNFFFFSVWLVVSDEKSVTPLCRGQTQTGMVAVALYSEAGGTNLGVLQK